MEKVTRLPLDPDRTAERRRLHLREVPEGGEPERSVGEELRAARLRVGEDIRTVAGALKIRRDHLEALEEGLNDRLPARAYAVGFVRSYAEYLGLDAAALVARFKEEIGALAVATPQQDPALVFPDAQEEARMPYGWVLLFAVLMGATLWGAFYLSQSADQLLGGQGSSKDQPPASLEQTEANAPASTTADPALAALPTTRVPPLPPGQAAAPPSPSVAAPAAPVNLTGRVLGATSPDVRVAIKALVPGVFVRVEDTTTGEPLINVKMNAGDVYRVPNRDGLILVTRNAGALELQFDGRSLGRVGPVGTALINFSLSPQAIGERAAAQDAETRRAQEALNPPASPPASAAPAAAAPSGTPSAKAPAPKPQVAPQPSPGPGH